MGESWLRRVALCLVAASLLVSSGAARADGGSPDQQAPGRLPELALAKDGDLWLVRADGRDLRRLTNHDDPAFPIGEQLAWSPDGTQLVYLSREYGFAPPGPLFLLDLATGQETRVAEQAADDLVAWAPDGRSFVVWGYVDSVTGPTTTLSRYDLAKGRLEPIALPLDSNAQLPCLRFWSISPDAQWVAYASFDGTLRLRSLVDGGERNLGAPPPAPPPLVSGHELCVGIGWSPDGQWLAWTQWLSDPATPAGPEQRVLWALRRDARTAAEATVAGTVSGGKGGHDIAASFRLLIWSPDSRWIDNWLGTSPPVPAPGAAPPGPARGWPGFRPCGNAGPACAVRSGAYHWSPDTAWVVYQAWRPLPGRSLQERALEVRLARRDSPIEVALASLTAATSEFYGTYVTTPFSPDERFVYYLTPEGKVSSFELATGHRFPLASLGCPSGIDYRCFAGATIPAWRPSPGPARD